jgi:deoxyribonuclease (pyrimidine dimer)
MTRINLVHPSELASKFLVAEYKEIVRIFGLARKAQYEIHRVKQPEAYTLGTGHCKFFYNRLQFISDRYDSLCAEMLRRSFKCNRVPKEDLHQGIERNMFFDYKPTEEALRINRERILERS